ncbi:MAG: response regulator [Chthonomonadales bacterium]|nr:response regulator [Chthonomonadales bacterium]
MQGKPITILLVEDDLAHAEIVRRNLERARVANKLIHVEDGEAALDYLFRRGAYADGTQFPEPGVVLLDLRLPKVDGLEVLRIVKSDPSTARLPVVVLTTSAAESDLIRAYDLGANSYLVKPVDYGKFAELMETFGYYWLVWNEYPH